MFQKTIIFIAFALIGTNTNAQEISTITNKKGSNILLTPIKELATTSVKSQDQSGTCWSFSTQSFLESEVLRLGKVEVDLSEMYIVRKCYEMKADKYVRMFGKTNFGAGGALHDLMLVTKQHGLVPQSAFPQLQEQIDHTE
jgi:bleomycin hydrolase